MSLFAKVFIVINLILTLVLVFFMATLLGQKADYKVRSLDAFRQQNETTLELKRKKEDFEMQVLNLGNLVRSTMAASNEETSKREQAETQIKRSDVDADSLSKEISRLEELKKTLDRNLADSKTQKAATDGQLTKSQQERDTHKGKERDAVQNLEQVETELRQLKERVEGLKK